MSVATLYNPPIIGSGPVANDNGLVDTLQSDPDHVTLVRTMPPSKRATTPGSDNAWVYSLQFTMLPTSSPASYERAGLIIQFKHGDPSQYGADQVTRDGVGIEVQGSANSQSSRLWTYDSVVNFPLGTDGYGVSFEGSLLNCAPPVNDPQNTSLGKFGFNLNASGPNSGTAACAVRGTGSNWYYGFYSDPNSIAPGGAAIRLDNTTGAGIVLSNGNPVVGRLASGSFADMLYVNRDNLLVIGGPGVVDVAFWNGKKYVMFSGIA